MTPLSRKGLPRRGGGVPNRWGAGAPGLPGRCAPPALCALHCATVRKIPLLVILNKMDGPDAVCTAVLREGMAALRPMSHTRWCVAEVSALSGEGVADAFKWLLERTNLPTAKQPSAPP